MLFTPRESLLARRLKRQKITAEIARIKESEAKTWSTKIDTIRKLVSALAFAYGIATAFVYFFLSANVFPSDVTFGDTLLFIFLAMGYALMALVFIGAGIGAILLPLAYRSKDKAKSAKPITLAGLFFFSIAFPFLVGYFFHKWLNECPWWVLVLVVFVTACVLYTNALRRKTQDWLDCLLNILQQTIIWTLFSICIWIWSDVAQPLILAASFSGLAAAAAMILLRESKSATKKNASWNAIIGLCAFAISTPLIFDVLQSKGSLVGYVFTQLGFRTSMTTVRLSGDSLNSVRMAAHTSGIDVAICYEDATHATIYPVDVLWHGIGTRSLLALSKKEDGLAALHKDDIEVAASELKLQRHKSTICQDLRTLPLFKSNSREYLGSNSAKSLAEEANLYLKHINLPGCEQRMDAPNKCTWHLNTIIVSGYTDNRPLKDDGNEKLACKRAAAILSDLKKTNGQKRNENQM